MVMGDRQDVDDVVDAGVHDLVREPPDWDAADRHGRTCAFDGRTSIGPLDGPSNRPIDRHDEAVGRVPVALAVLNRSFSDLGPDAGRESERSAHSTA